VNLVWTTLASSASTPSIRWMPAMGSAPNGRIYLFGGTDGTSLRDFFAYDPMAQAWTAFAVGNSTPSARSSSGMAATPDGRVFLFGGDGYTDSGDFYAFDPLTSIWSQCSGSNQITPHSQVEPCLSVLSVLSTRIPPFFWSRGHPVLCDSVTASPVSLQGGSRLSLTVTFCPVIRNHPLRPLPPRVVVILFRHAAPRVWPQLEPEIASD
jgi:hypothetical protein